MATKVGRPLVVICGPTASGKSDVAMQIARQKNGEIICADSRTIYRDMDIGTAKPSLRDRKEITHHLLDVVMPGQRFTAYDFQKQALEKIETIRRRGKLPILVGGTGLYIDAVIFKYNFENPDLHHQRQPYEAMTLEELHEYCIKHGISPPENKKNKRYVINAILKKGQISTRHSSPMSNSILVGVLTPLDILRKRIEKRAEHIFASGVVDEAKMLGKKYGWDNEAMTGNIYPIIKQYLDGKCSKEEAIEKFCTLDWRLAKRQLTWLKRNTYIYWSERDNVVDFVFNQLEKFEQK